MAAIGVSAGHGAGHVLVLFADDSIELVEQFFRILRGVLGEIFRRRPRLPLEKITAPGDPVVGGLPGTQDETGDRVLVLIVLHVYITFAYHCLLVYHHRYLIGTVIIDLVIVDVHLWYLVILVPFLISLIQYRMQSMDLLLFRRQEIFFEWAMSSPSSLAILVVYYLWVELSTMRSWPPIPPK